MNAYQRLLDAQLPPDPFVRQALQQLEADFRELALVALVDWASADVVSPELFQAAASLQRPSWGMWNGLLTALRNARKEVLRSRGPDERERVEQALVVRHVLDLFDESVDSETTKSLKGLVDLTRASLPKKAKLGAVLTLPIGLRNRIAHDAPTAESWWQGAAEAMRPLVELHAARDFLTFEPQPVFASPWFLVEPAHTWAFNGLATDSSVIYVSRDGETKFAPERARETLLEFQKLLGKTESQETDFRKLLSQLAPEEIKGVLMGDFLVGKPVGSGGFATVHVARQLSTGRKVAIKILHDGMTEDVQARFQQEARFLSQLEHDNIVAVYGYGEETWSAPRTFSLSDQEWFQTFSKSAPIKAFIAMEWIEGRTLEDVFKSSADAKPSERLLAEWFSQATSAIAAVHGIGLIHRDIKPSNLMVNRDNQIKLMDFGIARSQHESRTIVTGSGEAFGTPPYMSPEQLRAVDAEAEVGPSTDIYSLCATFYELFTNRRLYDHNSESAETVRTRKLTGERPLRPRLNVASLPWELEVILLGGLETELADRYPTAIALQRDIDHFLHDEPIEYQRPSLFRRMQLGYRRNRTVANLTAAFVGIAIVGTTYYVFRIAYERDVAVQARAEAVSHFRETRRAIDESITGFSDVLKYYPVENVRRKLLQKSTADYQRLAELRSDDLELEIERGRAHLRVGDLERSLNNHDAAQDAYQTAAAHFQSLAQRWSQNVTCLAEANSAQVKLGLLLTDRGDFAAADAAYQLAETGAKTALAKYPQDRLLREVLGAAMLNRGVLLVQTGKAAEAEPLVRTTIKHFEQLLAEHPQPSFHEHLATARNALGSLHYKVGQYDAAAKEFSLAVAAFDQLVQAHPDNPEFLHERVATSILLAGVYRLLGRTADEQLAYEDAIEDYTLLKDVLPGVPKVVEDLALVRVDLGQHLHERALNPAALTHLNKGLEEITRLIEESPQVLLTYHEIQAACRDTLGDVLADLGKFDAARKELEAAIATFQEIIELVKADVERVPGYQQRLAICESHLAELLFKLNETDLGREAFQRSLASLQMLATAHPNIPAYQNDLAFVHQKFANCLVNLDAATAKSHYQQAVELWQKMLTENAAPEYRHNLAWLLVTCPDATFQNPQQAVEIASALHEFAPRNATYGNTLGAAQWKQGQVAASLVTLSAASKLNASPNARDGFFLALAHHANSETETARQNYQAAKLWMDQQAPENSDLRRLRSEVERQLKIADK